MITELNYIRKDNLVEKFVSSKMVWVLLIFFFFYVPIYKSIHRILPKPLPIYNKVSSFKLTNQFGDSFGDKNLKGKIMIASFAFTSCQTTCLAIMKKMQTIQNRVRGLGDKIALLTFSVDPQHDTPKVLLKYSRKLHANPFVWTFLTGNIDEMKQIVTHDFMLAMGNREEVKKKIGDSEVTIFDIAHSGKVVLIDKNRNIRGFYSLDKNSINKLMIDTGLVINNAFRKSAL